jgi:Tfp pilus assembly protein PilE
MKPLTTIAIAMLITAIATTAALMADTLTTKITAKTGTIDLNLQTVTCTCGNRNTKVTCSPTKTGNTYTIQIDVNPPGNSKDSCTVQLTYENTGTIPIKIHTTSSISPISSDNTCTATTQQIHPGYTGTVNVSISCKGDCTCTVTSTAKSWNQ